MVKKTSLLELKKALNKVDDALLDNCYIMQKCWIDEPSFKIGVCFQDDEENFSKYWKMLDTKAGCVIDRFGKEIEKDRLAMMKENASDVSCQVRGG